MKRKWIWVLAIAPLIVGFVFARRLANKRPQLLGRHMAAWHLLPSSDGEWLFVQYRDSDIDNGRIVGMNGDLKPSDSSLYVLPSLAMIQRVRTVKNSEGLLEGVSFDPTDFDSNAPENRDKKRFMFLGARDDLYGACVRSEEIVVESRQQTWHLDSRNLHILATQKRKRSLTNVLLCPDGKTLIDDIDGEKGIYQFIDLETEKPLWKRRLGAYYNLNFSFDGRLLVVLENGVVIARDTRTGVEKWRLRGPKSWVLAVSPDESTVYEARENGELWKWPR